MKLLVTGLSGLVGSESALRLHAGYDVVHGIDNNMRMSFFGPGADTSINLEFIKRVIPNLVHHNEDIRNRDYILDLFKRERFDAVVHCAAQPSHDLAASRPFDDFEVNALGTLNLLEAARRYSCDKPFLFMSTNKVYGDGPNSVKIKELDLRWDFDDPEYADGIDEKFPVDYCKHSLFGASKLSADILVQEYGRYFDMPTVCFRAGCVTGSRHASVEAHGFLSYLFKCASDNKPYTIYGFKGKQVRDQIHSADVVSAFKKFLKNPKPAAVYNIGGGRENSASILECIEMIKEISGLSVQYTILDKPRIGDHICYISNTKKLQHDYPGWSISINLRGIIEEMKNSVNS